jgi:hypothetical protein
MAYTEFQKGYFILKQWHTEFDALSVPTVQKARCLPKSNIMLIF